MYWESENLRVQPFNYLSWKSEGHRIIFHESDRVSRFFFPPFFWKSRWRKRKGSRRNVQNDGPVFAEGETRWEGADTTSYFGPCQWTQEWGPIDCSWIFPNLNQGVIIQTRRQTNTRFTETGRNSWESDECFHGTVQGRCENLVVVQWGGHEFVIREWLDYRFATTHSNFSHTWWWWHCCGDWWGDLRDTLRSSWSNARCVAPILFTCLDNERYTYSFCYLHGTYC
jgi:hypothetical protein